MVSTRLQRLVWSGLAIFLLIGCTRSFPEPSTIGSGTPAVPAPYPDSNTGPTEPPLPFPTPLPVTPGDQPYPGPIPASATVPADPTVVPPTPTAPPTPGTPAGDQAQHVLLLPFIPYSEWHPIAERVLIISIDGLRPEGIYNSKTGKVNAPFIFSLSQQGAVDWTAQTVSPSTTLPGHASMLSGYGVEKHGVDLLRYLDIIKRGPFLIVPTVFDHAHELGFRTIMVSGKKKLGYFHRPGTLDVVHIFNDNSYEDRFDADVGAQARRFMREGFGVMFLHFGDTDTVGHSNGWLSKPYMGTVRRLDKTIKTLFNKLESLGLLETTLVIITTDHGGDDFGHSGSGPRDLTIPWIIVGPQVRPGTSLSDIQIYDTAPTALWALGIPLPPDLDGRVVREAFQNGR